MKKIGLFLALSVVASMAGGQLKVWSNQAFALPDQAAPGGEVIAEITCHKSLRVKLNNFILGVFTPQDGRVKVNLTPAVNYASNNVLTLDGARHAVTLTYEENSAYPEVILQLQRDKVRLISAALGNVERAQQIKNCGFNVAMGWSGIHKNINLEQLPATGPLVNAQNLPRLNWWKKEISLAHAHGLIPLPLMWFHRETKALLQKAGYDQCQTIGYGKQSTPCPLDATYWDRLIKPTMKTVAELYRDLNLPGGMTLDQEFYGVGFPGFTYGGAEDGCFCDSCMKHFFEIVGEKFDLSEVKKGNRLKYLVKRGYSLEDYLGVAQLRLSRKLAEIMTEVRAIKPDFMVAVMPGKPNWYINGICRGIACRTMPVLVFGENEYFVGYSAKSRHKQQNWQRWGFPMMYVPGLTISAYSGEGLGVKAVECAQNSAGYWLYYGEELLTKGKVRKTTDAVRPSEYALRDTQTNYLAAMTVANKYLAKHPQGFHRAPVVAQLPESASKQVTAKGIVLPTTIKLSGNLLTSQPKYVKPRVLTAEGDIFCNMAANESHEVIWRDIPVQAGQKYRMQVQVKAADLSHRAVDFRVLENKKIIAQHGLSCEGVAEWKTLSRVFTPKSDKITVMLIAYGTTGYAIFKQPELAPVVPFNQYSRRFGVEIEALNLPIGEQIYAELVNPQTKMGYFRLLNGVNDLRLLHAIYGRKPQCVRIFGDVTGNIEFAK